MDPEAENPLRFLRTPSPPAVPLAKWALEFLRGYGTEQTYRRNQVIFYQGHRPLGLYVHESGPVVFLRGQQRVCRCRETCLMAPDALVTDEPLAVSARAGGDVGVIFVGRTALAVLTKGLSTRHHRFQAILESCRPRAVAAHGLFRYSLDPHGHLDREPGLPRTETRRGALTGWDNGGRIEP